MLSKFESVWDSHLGWIKPAPWKIDISPTHLRPIHTAQYQAGSKAKDSRIMKFARCSSWKSLNQLKLSGNCQLSSHPKSALQSDFAWTSGRYAKLQFLIPTSLHVFTSTLRHLETLLYSLHWRPISALGKSRLSKGTERKKRSPLIMGFHNSSIRNLGWRTRWAHVGVWWMSSFERFIEVCVGIPGRHINNLEELERKNWTLETVLMLLHDVDGTMKLKKCKFLSNTIETWDTSNHHGKG